LRRRAMPRRARVNLSQRMRDLWADSEWRARMQAAMQRARALRRRRT
jgi:hypothetical protein